MKCTIYELPGIKTEDINYNRVVATIGLADVTDMDKNNDLYIFVSCLIHGGLKKVIFDMAAVEFIDSYGIGTVIDITKLIRKNKDGDVVLVNVSERIQLIFKPIQIQKFLKIFNTMDEALHYFRYI